MKLKNKLYTPSVYICGLLTLVTFLITYTVIVSVYLIFFCANDNNRESLHSQHSSSWSDDYSLLSKETSSRRTVFQSFQRTDRHKESSRVISPGGCLPTPYRCVDIYMCVCVCWGLCALNVEGYRICAGSKCTL